ncbi:sugar phosphate nucleotidyltransferase [Amycolatopsis sp. NBC_00345]|uniref:sugar nucleotidyltransferase n=1 Tax=Amycolatopsis sp. NBC_00345 TaxID=2975955 RepID=UPI002E26320F
MKGIVLATGTDPRLHPITLAVPQHLLPVGDKPMIYYPLSVLMLAGIRDILVIASPSDAYQRLLGDGSQLGLRVDYAEQPERDGVAEALLTGADHIGTDQVALILGDTLLPGPAILRDAARNVDGCVLFGEPSTGLYLYDGDVVDIVKNLRRPAHGQPEITDVNQVYRRQGRARLIRGFARLDASTPDSLIRAGQYVRAVEQRHGQRIACVEEVALRMGFITAAQCYRLGARQSNSPYGQYVMRAAAITPPRRPARTHLARSAGTASPAGQRPHRTVAAPPP